MNPTYRDPAMPIGSRVDDLLSRMTLREKVGQLNQRLLGWRTWERVDAGVRTTALLDEEIERWGGIGAVYGLLRADAWSGRDWVNGADPALSRDVAAVVQERIVRGSRLGVPALFVEEAPHGHQALGSQLLPVNLAAAATWRPELVEDAAAHTAREVRARGAHLALVSGLDILRDPRWGRAEECFGEDPLLASLFVRAQVRGMLREPGVGVVLKHFAGQGAAMGGRNGSGTPIGPRELAELHLSAAHAGIDEGALGVMAAYNDIDGVPCCASAGLLTGILRDDWGFEGIVMSDMLAIDRLQRTTLSATAAGALALRAGVDLSMCDESFTVLEQAIAEGLANEEDVDRAVRRVLALKFRLGLFEAATAPRSDPMSGFPAPDPTIDVGAAALVLLQDRGAILPLGAAPDRLAVIGPNADDLDSLLGDYAPPLAPGVGGSVLAAFRDLLGPDVMGEPGCALTRAIEGGLERARDAAAAADLVVLVLGSTSARGDDDDFLANGAASLGGRPPAATTGEGFDVAEVELPAAQRDLVAAVTTTGTPTVAVIVSGRPLGIDTVAERCDAIVYAWYPGPEGGRAIASAILGGREPTGRLPVSLPRSSGTLPVAYNERLETTRRYVDSAASPVFGFGAGLGYTTWRLGAAQPSADTVSATRLAELSLQVPVANTGERAGTQVVQLYARARVPGILPRAAVLVGFARIELEPGVEAQLDIPVLSDAIDGLGIPVGSAATLELWCSIDGPGDQGEDVVRLAVTGARYETVTSMV